MSDWRAMKRIVSALRFSVDSRFGAFGLLNRLNFEKLRIERYIGKVPDDILIL